MPRIGQNPMKWLGETKQPQRITITTIVHLPTLEGYWQQGLKVLQTCLHSLWQHTGHPFDLMLLDNGSCQEVQDYLLQAKREGLIQYLILSDYNLRKLGALDFLLHVAPGEIISFTDSDVYFLPGWLDASLQILQCFPEAGQVTALPTADRMAYYCEHTQAGVTKDTTITVQKGNLIPEKYIRAHALSLGVAWEDYQDRLVNREDVLIERNGVQAFVSAQDFQFTTTRQAVQAVLPLRLENPDHYYDPLYSPVFEAKLDGAGYWRLSTTEYLAHHMGNSVPNLEEEIAWLPAETLVRPEGIKRPVPNPVVKQKGRIRQNRFVRRALKQLNTFSYKLLYE